MANDWIKMRMDLQSHPKIVRILSATKTDKFRVIGGLHALWCVFDTHSEDGFLPGYTLETMDHIIGWPGFSTAVADVDWLKETPEGLGMPEFSEHNGKSAKRRGEETKRKRSARTGAKGPQSVRKVSAEIADKMQTREEKRREEIEENSLSGARDEFELAENLSEPPLEDPPHPTSSFDQFQMRTTWEPHTATLDHVIRGSGVSVEQCLDVLPAFRLNKLQTLPQTEIKWCSQLVSWALRERQYASRDSPKRGREPMRMTGFDDVDYMADARKSGFNVV